MSDRFQFPRRYAKRETVKRPFQIVKTWLTPNVGDSNPGTSDADSTIQNEIQESSSPDDGDTEFTAASKAPEASVDPPLVESAESQEGQQKDIEAEPEPTLEEAEPPITQETQPGTTKVELHHDVLPKEPEPEQEELLQVCTEDHRDSDHDVEMPCIQDALILELQPSEEIIEESGLECLGEGASPKSCRESGLKDVEPDDALGHVDRWTVKNWTDVGNPETQEQASKEALVAEQVVEVARPHTISDVPFDVPVSEQMPDITASSSEETADPASSSVNISEQEISESISSEIVNENRVAELTSRKTNSAPIQSSPTKEFSIRLERIEVEKYLSSGNGKGNLEIKTNRGSASQETSKTSRKIIRHKGNNASTSDDEDRITSSTHVDKIPREKSHLQPKASEKKSTTKARPKSTKVLPEDDVPGSEDTMDSETSFQPVDDVTNVEKEHAGKISKLSPLIKSASVRNKKNQSQIERDSSSLESDTSNRDALPVTKKRAAVEVSKPKSAKQRKKSPKSESSPQSKATVSSYQQKVRRSAKDHTLSPDVESSTSDSGSGKVKPHRITPLRKKLPKMLKQHEDSSSEISQEWEVDESYRRANTTKARSRYTESMPILEETLSTGRAHSQVTKDAKLDTEDNVKSRGRKKPSRSKSLSPSADMSGEVEEENDVISRNREKNNRSQSLSPSAKDVEEEHDVKSQVKPKYGRSKSLSPSADLDDGEEDIDKPTGRERYHRSVSRSPAGQEGEEELEQQRMKSTGIDVRTLPGVPLATSAGEGGEATNDSDIDASSVNTSLQLEMDDMEVTPRGARHASALTGSLWKGKKISALTKRGMTSRKLVQTTRSREEDTPGFVSTSPAPAKKKPQTKDQRKPSTSQASRKPSPVKRKNAKKRQNADDEEEEERPRGRSVSVWSTYDQPRKGTDIMDLDIVLECLRTTERDMLADADSRTCEKATQKVSAYVRKEIHKSISLAQQIKQRQRESQKARTRVKNMRVDLQEKQKDKLKLTSKLKKLQVASGIDEDLININSWLDDSEKLMREWDKSKAGQTKPQKYKWIGELSEEMKSLC
ncbi:peptidyl-prolyl cis-trans isomerase G-like [Haliotis asinina]|uniref:peptidyl-prolyl cis-trans isomerase G-like n=1 Tax=Haliotis asinina TaxID=109174 RepID=UPI003532466E